MTFDDIVNVIIETTGRSDKQTTIDTRVSQAITEIQRLHNHYFMEQIATRDLVIDADDYEVPADFKDIKNIWLLDEDGNWGSSGMGSVWYEGSGPLKELNMEQARRHYQADDEGDPEAFTIYRRSIFVWPPKPQDDAKKLQLEYYRFLPPISGASSNEITDVWGDLIEAWATWKFYMKMPNAESMAKQWEGLARPQHENLIKYSNDYRLKGKVVMPVRTSPKQRDRSMARPFGGR